MANLRLYGDTSGYVELVAPTVGTNGTITLPTSGVIPGVKRSATAPTDPFAGDIWYNTSTQETSIYDGTTWVAVSGTGRATSFFLGGM